MVDYTIDVYTQLMPHKAEEVKKDLMKRRAEVVAEFQMLVRKCTPIMDAINAQDTKEFMTNCRDGRQLFEYVSNKFDGISSETINDVYAFAKHYYNCGNYNMASDLLVVHRLLIPPHDPNYSNNIWGKLASNILSQVCKRNLFSCY